MRSWIVAALLCLASVAEAAEFQIAPDGRLRSTDPVRIALVDAPPNLLIDISAERLSQNGVEWFGATARIRVDKDGRVDLDSRPSLGGAYTGVDAYGLFWAMGAATRPEGVEATPGQFRFTVRLVDGPQIALRTASFSNGREEVMETAAPFPKAFLMQPRTGRPRATLILLGGSEGGDTFARGIAPRLAANGYAVLGLPYWQVEGLPKTFEDIPVDRLQQAYDWIARQPGLDADKVQAAATLRPIAAPCC